jgi:hypothetical protein
MKRATLRLSRAALCLAGLWAAGPAPAQTMRLKDGREEHDDAMIGKLKGVVDSYGEDFVILDVHGVGFGQARPTDKVTA